MQTVIRWLAAATTVVALGGQIWTLGTPSTASAQTAESPSQSAPRVGPDGPSLDPYVARTRAAREAYRAAVARALERLRRTALSEPDLAEVANGAEAVQRAEQRAAAVSLRLGRDPDGIVTMPAPAPAREVVLGEFRAETLAALRKTAMLPLCDIGPSDGPDCPVCDVVATEP